MKREAMGLLGLAVLVGLGFNDATMGAAPLPQDSSKVRTPSWAADKQFFPDLEFMTACSPTDSKHAQWDTSLRSTKDWIIEVTVNGKTLEVPPFGTMHLDPVQAKNCNKPPVLRMDARKKDDPELYAIQYKDGTVKAKGSDDNSTSSHHWGAFVAGLAMAGAGVMEAKAANDTQAAAARAEQQAERRAAQEAAVHAAQQQALQAEQMRAAYMQEQAAEVEAAAARQAAAQAAAAQQAAAQRAAALAATQAAQNNSRSNGHSSGSGPSGYSSSAGSVSGPRPQDLSISSLDVLDQNTCEVHFTLNNASSAGASVTVRVDVRDNGAVSSAEYPVYAGPYSSNPFVRNGIVCGTNTDDVLNNYAHSDIVAFQFQ